MIRSILQGMMMKKKRMMIGKKIRKEKSRKMTINRTNRNKIKKRKKRKRKRKRKTS